MNHLIGRQIIDVRTGSSGNAFQLQHELSNLFQRLIAPELERQFDRLVGPDELVRIDRLEIDLGTLEEEDLLTGKFLPELKRLLTEAIEKALREQAPGVRRLRPAEGQFERWLQFLEKGFLPWAGPRPTGNWLEGVKETLGQHSVAVESLRRLVSNDSRAFERLLLQQDAAFFRALTELFTGQSQEKLLWAFREWNDLVANAPALAALLPAPTTRRRAVLFWRQVFQLVIVEGRKMKAAELIRQVVTRLAPLATPGVIAELSRLEPDRYPLIGSTLQAMIAARNAIEGLDAHPKQDAESETPSGKPEAPEERPSRLPEMTDAPEETYPTGQTPEEEPIHREKDRSSDPDDPRDRSDEERPTEEEDPAFPEEASFPPAEVLPEGTEIFVENAGIVLLHAFLVRFFDVLELLDAGDFKDQSARHRAVQLLHFMATGEDRIPEYQLPLPKLLCGLPLNMPVDAELTLSEEEREESEALLEAIIDNWGALGDVSIASLREGFLQRNGKLSKLPTGWHLQVEQQTLDILLEKLPWGIGIVKLPWMPEMLRVEWR